MSGIGDRVRDRVADQIWGIHQADGVALSGLSQALAHLRARIVQAHDPGAARPDHRFREREDLSEQGVKPPRDVASELDVLPLILTDRNQVGAI